MHGRPYLQNSNNIISSYRLNEMRNGGLTYYLFAVTVYIQMKQIIIVFQAFVGGKNA